MAYTTADGEAHSIMQSAPVHWYRLQQQMCVLVCYVSVRGGDVSNLGVLRILHFFIFKPLLNEVKYQMYFNPL